MKLLPATTHDIQPGVALYFLPQENRRLPACVYPMEVKGVAFDDGALVCTVDPVSGEEFPMKIRIEEIFVAYEDRIKQAQTYYKVCIMRLYGHHMYDIDYDTVGEYLTYQEALDATKTITGTDLIIIDEMHRHGENAFGQPVWKGYPATGMLPYMQTDHEAALERKVNV